MAYTYTKQQLEDFTRNGIVATHSGLYKLTKLREFKHSENNYGENFKSSCIAEFTPCNETGKSNGIAKSVLVEIPGYTLSFTNYLSIYDSCGMVDSYVEDEERAKTNVFSASISSLNGSCDELEYFREFFVNYAKQSQNEYNLKCNEKEIFGLEFIILNASKK